MPLYPANMASHAPARSLTDYRCELIGRRLQLLLTQWSARRHTTGHAIGKQIADIEGRLRAIDEARR